MAYAIPSQTLYGFGIVMIELWYGKAFAELHEVGDGARDSVNTESGFLTMFDTAFRPISELEDEAGET